ncbi:hypothetical protein RQP46_004187 [Phenoliferia psychrophenolica]
MSYTSNTQASTGSAELLGIHPTFARNQAAKKPVVGSWTMLPGASLARMVAQMGFDFVLVDCEHGNIDDGAMHSSVGAIAAQGCSPIIRVAAPTIELVKRALDTGCHGIMVPMMNTAAEAATLVSYAKFPVPTALRAKDASLVSGIRGVGSPFAPAVFGQNLTDYIATANRNTFVCVQIESVEGLNNCEEIAKVPGIDMLFVGPNDLCSSMGFIAGEHEDISEVQAAIARVLAACKSAGKYAGMFCTSGEQVLKRHEQGFDFMNLGLDILAIGAWNAAELAKISKIR